MRKKFLKSIDWGILICSAILLAIGMVALFSATANSDYEELKKQIMWCLISIPVLIITIVIDYRFLTKISVILYAVINILLFLVLFTEPINGATSWFIIAGHSFQPAEFAKIVLVLFLAYIIAKIQRKDKDEINRFWKLSMILVLIAIPIILIVKQPDYGTAMTFMVAIILMLFVAGINKKYIIVAILIVAITLPLLYAFVLPEHAKSRISIYLDPYKDPRGAGYNVIQSKLAIGAGQVFGMGLLKGNQTQLGYLYPKSTDFIYAVIGEEMGFVVAGLVIGVYVVLIARAINIAKKSKDDIGAYIATGVTGILLFHVVENIGMTMGLLPITGVPLLFVSYGGSSLLTSFMLIGLLINVGVRTE